jgi:pimeloyl-ACP methyl ester carboxylesterase
MPRRPATKRQDSHRIISATTSPPAQSDKSSPVLTPFILKNEEVERALLTGSHKELLEDYFGVDQVGSLQRLARDASGWSGRGGERVLILPGIMGSTLGFPREVLWDDVIWVDPVDILLGNLRKLQFGEGRRDGIKALGVLLFAYLSLKLRLKSSGFDADFYPFDWRQDIHNLGQDLAKRLQNERGPVHLVAHSMGGLVARAALKHEPANLGRIIMLGTPNFGSFSPIQAFRGVHSIVSKIARLDVTSTQDDLGCIFRTFPGLCQMFPAPLQGGGIDYFSLASWPSTGVLPSEEMLRSCRGLLAGLPPADQRFTQIVGCNRETVISATVSNGEFIYTTSLDGDGTVPMAFARLPDCETYFIAEEHGNLPNNVTVAKAVEEILTKGKTGLLQRKPPATRGGIQNVIPERTLRIASPMLTMTADGRGRRAGGTREMRELLSEFASPPKPQIASAPAVVASPTSVSAEIPSELCDRIVIGRRHQLRLDITLVFGSITEIDASAYVLGLFGQVSPGGAAKTINELMDGAVMQLSERRMLNANVGAVSFLPKGRHPLQADLIAFVGLGSFDSFKEETLEAAAENLIRTLLLTRIDDFAMVPFGGGSGIEPGKALHHMMKGFTRGLVDGDGDQRFRGVTICEIDPDRYRQLQQCLYRLCGTSLFDNVEVTLREKRVAVPRRGMLERQIATPQPIYLMVRQEKDTPGTAVFVSSLLTVGEKATTFTTSQKVNLAVLERHLDQIKPNNGFDVPTLETFGETLAELVLSRDMRAVLSEFSSQHLVVVHDAGASRIPWETIHINQIAPALSGGLSHRYEAKDLSTAKWLQKRQLNRILSMLLIVNPTGDLPGADREGERIADLMKELGPSVQFTTIRNGEARRKVLIEALSSGEFDVVHYAGHAFFDAESPERSGILCPGREVLAGSDLAPLANLPSLMFFNACEAARIRRDAGIAEPEPSLPDRLHRGVGFAESLLRGGVANYVGTYWPVGDTAAKDFAEQFYQSLVAGATLGDAIMKGRKTLKNASFADWADYVLYGDPNFILKPTGGERVSIFDPI